MALPIRFSILRALTKELAVAARDERPISISGPLADVLRRELVRDGDPAAVRVTDDPRGAAILVQILGRTVTGADEETMKRARRHRVPIVALSPEDVRLAYVLATDIVPLPPGAGFPVDAVAHAIARRLGEHATSLAARLPVLRGAVCDALVGSFARKNALIAAAVFVPGADLAPLTLNQLRLVLRIASAHGHTVEGGERVAEIGATLGAGLGFRALARELLGLVPLAGWALQAGVAYTGTVAVGETAVQWFAGRAPVRDGEASRPRPAAASPAVP